MKERVGDEKLIISIAVRGINDHISATVQKLLIRQVLTKSMV